MTNEINSYYLDHKPTKKDEGVIDLGADDGVTFSSLTAVSDAINAARWETEGRAHKSCAGSLMGYKFFTESVSAELSTYDGFVDPDNIRVNRGDRASFPSLLCSLPTDTKIYIPVPTARETLSGVKEYFDAPRLFLTDHVFDKPVPNDIEKLSAETSPEVIYLSLSNDPTGLTFTYSELAAWIEYAKTISAVIIFDTTLEIFCEVSEWRREYPHTIYEIPGACECAVEVCSFAPSYRAGIPCGYCVIPSGVRFRGRSLLAAYDKKLKAASKKTTESNCFERHVSYVIQRGAAAHLSPAGKLESMRTAKEYQRNARKLCAALALKGFECVFNGVSPYVFGRFCTDSFCLPFPQKSVSACDHLESKLALRVLRGDAFGLPDRKGSVWEEYLRISGAVSHEKAEEACLRIFSM